MLNLLRTEFYKLFHSLYFWRIGLFNLLLSSILLLDSYKKTTSLFFASLYNTPLLYSLIIVFAALFVGNDFEQRTLYTYISAGQKRSYVIFIKALVYQIACFAILLIPLLIHGLLGFLFLKETFVFTDDVFITVIVIAISVLAMCMMPLLFSFIFRDIGITLVLSMVIFFLMIFLMNGEWAWLITNIFPMGQLRLVSLQQLSLNYVQFIVIDFLWILLLYWSSYAVFGCSDLR